MNESATHVTHGPTPARTDTSPGSASAPSGGWFRYAAPQRFYPLAGRLVAWLAAGATALALIGLYIGFVVAPTDAQQGEAYRIIFVHVPAAWMSMVVYLAMAFWAAVGLIYNARLASMMACALAPTGALMTFLALWTGALWGQPTWGTWWVWDARLTSELLLLFLYIGFMALHGAIEDRRRADRAAGVLALVGVVNIPIIYFSVKWWNTLHQGASVSFTQAPSMAATMLAGMLVMAVAFWLYAMAASLARLRVLILEREAHAAWVRELANPMPAAPARKVD
jgi:heme exporter protein C